MMQSDFFIFQDQSDPFVINFKGEKKTSGQMLGPLEDQVAPNQEEMGFLTTLVGVAHDQGFPKPEDLTMSDSITGEVVSGKNQMMSLEKVFEDKVPETKPGGHPWNENIKANIRLIQNSGGSTMGSEQKGSGVEKGDMKANDVIKISYLSDLGKEDGLQLKSAIQSSNHTTQKAWGDSWIEGSKANAKVISKSRDVPMGPEQKGSGIEKGDMKANDVIKISYLSDLGKEDGLQLKSAIQSSNHTTQKAWGDSWIEGSKANAKVISKSRDVPMGPEQKGSGIEKGDMKANEVIKASSLSNLAEEHGLKLKNANLSFDHTTEKMSVHPETDENEKKLLMKLRMALQKVSEETDKPIIHPDRNRPPDGVSRKESPHNLNTNFQGDDRINKHPSKDQPLEGAFSKSRPGLQDIEAMIKKMDVLPRGRAGNEAAGIDSAIRENTLSVQNSQTQERIPETMSAAKEMEFFQKPLQTTVLKQLVERAAMDLNNGRTAIKINLKPEYLGYLRMEISTDNHQVMVKIMTEIPLVKGIIENNINQLKTALGEHGLEMDDLDVFVAHDSDKQGGRDRHTEFTNMESGAGGKRIEGVLPGEELITSASENILGENIIDFFA